jgi:hypothetical protein
MRRLRLTGAWDWLPPGESTFLHGGGTRQWPEFDGLIEIETTTG